MLQSFGNVQRYIGNLGHGLHPTHDPHRVGVFIEALQAVSREMTLEQSRWGRGGVGGAAGR